MSFEVYWSHMRYVWNSCQVRTLMRFKCVGAFLFFLSSDFNYIKIGGLWLLISCFVCTSLLLFHVQVDVILAQRNRKLFMLAEENFFFLLTCLCFVILLISLCKCTVHVLGVFSSVCSRVEKTMHTIFLITPWFFTYFHILMLLV